MISKIPAFVCMLLVLPATAADMAAGQRIAQTCMACHGADGVSVADNIPNIAAQKPKYIVSQLEAFKAGKRENKLMNAIAAQLSAEQMADVAAYFAAKGGASDGGQQASLAPSMTKTRVAFPADYASNFTHYTTINFESRKQVRRYLANEAALAAAREGSPMPAGAMILVEVHGIKLDATGNPVIGDDGFFESTGIKAYTAMAVGDGWGEQFPSLLRNGDWQYAVFQKDGSVKPGVNQGSCLACHKPLESDSYVFTLSKIRDRAGSM